MYIPLVKSVRSTCLVYSPTNNSLESINTNFPKSSNITISIKSTSSETKEILNTPLVGLGYIFRLFIKLELPLSILIEDAVLKNCHDVNAETLLSEASQLDRTLHLYVDDGSSPVNGNVFVVTTLTFNGPEVFLHFTL